MTKSINYKGGNFKGRHHSEETKNKIRDKKIGKIPWNKGLKGFRAGEKRPNILPKGSSNGCWKGDGVGYRGLHKWVELMLGKPTHCANCKKSSLKPRQYQWANVSHAYKRELSDWVRLCVKCHKAYDLGKIKLSII